MTLGISIGLIALGAILAFAVTASVAGISLSTVGLILMFAGVVGAVLSFLPRASRDAQPRGRSSTAAR
jgi:hypothetical protein